MSIHESHDGSGSEHGLKTVADGELLSHEYDGIKEFDNPTPGWWHYLFIVTILLSFPYFMYWETNQDAPTLDVLYAEQRSEAQRKQFAGMGTLGMDEPTLAKALANPAWLDIGHSIYKMQCASCHGMYGQGIVGPNMTDDRYKHIKSLADFPRVVQEGAAEGAMPAWKSRLSTNEVVLAAAYVASLRGQNVAGKPPEGEPVAAWPVATPGK